jgi:hypothetical protein
VVAVDLISSGVDLTVDLTCGGRPVAAGVAPKVRREEQPELLAREPSNDDISHAGQPDDHGLQFPRKANRF